MEKLEVIIVEKKSCFELWVTEYKIGTFTKTLSGRSAAKTAQTDMWKFLNYLGRSYPFKAVRKYKSL